MNRPQKTELSKNLKGMKFMLRKEEAERRAKQEDDHAKQLQEAHWVAHDKEAKGGLSLDDGLVFSRKTGRRSFGKFNPSVEKLYNKHKKGEQGKEFGEEQEGMELEGSDNETSVSDMATRFKDYVGGSKGTIVSPYGKKRGASEPVSKKDKKRKRV